MIHLPIGERFTEATSKQFFIISLYNLFIYLLSKPKRAHGLTMDICINYSTCS